MSEQTDQSAAIGFLGDPSSYRSVDRVERFETHGNLVFLAGEDAWKIKRAVRFDYMDFSTLEKRRAACVREVEINRRFASDIYLGCVPIVRSADGRLAFAGSGEVVEWAVHMRRFEQSALLGSIAAKSGIGPELARPVADVVYDCHEAAEPAACALGVAPVRNLTASLCSSLAKLEPFDSSVVATFAREADAQLARAATTLDERARRGFVRRCHGDLHLANIVVWKGRPVLYDAIEFDEALATIDTLYDLAFLLMDLDRHEQKQAASMVLNRYLWRSGASLDLDGLAALPLFLGLRAGVRAMVTADRAAQEGQAAAARDRERALRYLRAALAYVRPTPPRLVAVGGLSGTGKSTLASALAPWLGCSPGAVHLRSDLERKALAGVGEVERLPAAAYAPEARRRVYSVLEDKGRRVLAARHAVITDAVYASEEERRGIEDLAEALGVPFSGLWLKAEPEALLDRVAARRGDASDATPDIVRAQLQYEPGVLSPAWIVIDAGGAAEGTLRLACTALGIDRPPGAQTMPSLLDDRIK